MKELQAILEGLAEAGRREESAVLATVVGVRGSAYRRPGARLLLRSDGRSVGAISGGCLEGDVADRALRKDASAEPFVVRYDTASDEEIAWELGLGCGGVVDVLIERIDPIHRPRFLAFLRRCLEHRPGVLARVIRTDGTPGVRVGTWLTIEQSGETADDFTVPELASRVRRDVADVLKQGRSRHAAYDGPGGRVEVFHELLRPSPALLLCGAGHDAPPVARLAGELGWRVTVCDRRPAWATPERFPTADEVIVCRPPDLLRHFVPEPGGAAIVMTHDYLDDQCFLEALLPLPLRYIGILGVRRRTDSLLRCITAGGYLPEQRSARLHGPIGLDLGAETPEEIALAVVAEIQAVFAGREAGFLRDKRGPIHDRPLGDEIAAPRTNRPTSIACALRAE